MMNTTRIFISYASEDRGSALSIYRYLLSRDFAVWIDCECLLPGQHWRSEIEREISESDFFIAVISNNSISKRGYVQKELKIALDVLDTIPHGEIYLIPVRIEECRVRHPALSSIHYIDMFGDKWRRGARYILRAIERRKGRGIRPTTALYAIAGADLMEAAIMARDISALTLLLNRGADPSDPRVAYGSPLEFLLCEHEDDEIETVLAILDLFFRHGADPNQKCTHNSSLIAQVAYLEKLPIMELLIEHKANLEHQNDQGETCLMSAASFGAVEAVRLLLKHRVKVNSTDKEGWTALMHASSLRASGDTELEEHLMEVGRLLIAQGANVSCQNAKGQTAADLAAESDMLKLEAFLRAQPSY